MNVPQHIALWCLAHLCLVPILALAQPQGDPQQTQQQAQQSETGRPRVTRSVTGQAGRDIRIGVFASLRSDCTAGSLPVIRLKAKPKHGRVQVKQGKLRATNHRNCLATEVPAFIVVYRSGPDFEGQDEVELEVGTGNRVQVQRITITVTNAKGVQRT